MKLKILNESMTKLERAAKAKIEKILGEQGYPRYARLLDLFDVNLTADPNVIGYMEPGKARIVLNKELSEDQVSTVVRHEILHEFLSHALRDERLRQSNPKFKGASHDIMNIAADYEISNVGYTDKDKSATRAIKLGDNLLRGLVTEDDHPDWVNKSFEEMFELLNDEYKDKLDEIESIMKRIGGKGDQAIQDAEELDRQANAIPDEISDEELQDALTQLADEAKEIAGQIKQGEDGLFKPTEEQRNQAILINKVNKIKKEFNDTKNKAEIESENREAKRVEKQTKETNKYKNSPIIKFRESLVKFIKNEISYLRGASWKKYNKTYGNIGVLRPGHTNVQTPVPLINVYFDRSGSWDASKTENGAKAIATLNKYVQQGQLKIKLYYFSNNVHTVERDAEAEGGTNGQPILNHIEQTKPTNVIILTDSDISDCKSYVTVPGGVWLLFYQGRSQNLIEHLKGKALTRIFDM